MEAAVMDTGTAMAARPHHPRPTAAGAAAVDGDQVAVVHRVAWALAPKAGPEVDSPEAGSRAADPRVGVAPVTDRGVGRITAPAYAPVADPAAVLAGGLATGHRPGRVAVVSRADPKEAATAPVAGRTAAHPAVRLW